MIPFRKLCTRVALSAVMLGVTSTASFADDLGTFVTYPIGQRTMSNLTLPLRTFTGTISFSGSAYGGVYNYTVVQSSGTADEQWTLVVTGVYAARQDASGHVTLTLTPQSATPIAPLELQRLEYEGFPSTHTQNFDFRNQPNSMELEVYTGYGQLRGVSLFFKKQ